MEQLNLAKYIRSIIEERPKREDIKWLAQQIGVNYWTFYGHLQRNSFSAMELLKIAKVLNIDLNQLRDRVVL